MTTSVKVFASCSTEEEVLIKLEDGENVVSEMILNDGESAELLVYSERKVFVTERRKITD